jgi:hypothetical protein
MHVLEFRSIQDREALVVEIRDWIQGTCEMIRALLAAIERGESRADEMDGDLGRVLVHQGRQLERLEGR